MLSPSETPEPEAAEPEPAEPEPTTPDVHGRLAFAFVNEAGLILSTEAIRAWSTDDDGAEYDAFEAAHPSAKEIRRKVWSSASENTLWLAAKLISDGDCQGALWARDHELAPPTVLRRTTDVSEPGRRRLAEHHASEELAAVKAHYIEWYREQSEFGVAYDPWETLVRRHPATVASWLEADVVRVVELEFGEESEGCGDGDDTRITSVDLVVGTAFEALDSGSHPTAVFDADLDGKFELLYSDELSGASWYLGSDTLEASWSLDEVFVCPC
ncbi:MAG: hypothetical protein JKY37_29655 [Nannocystaceae bacterium]|nr:hypothetical protein [Nannocystaceae bacterium]